MRVRKFLALPLGGALMAAMAPSVAAQQNPADALPRHVQTLASDPDNFDALIGAGDAALAVDDLASAAGFFGRAAESYPSDPRPLVGLGRLAAQMGETDKAFAYFEQAASRGASAADLGAGRGLAFDLTGRLEAGETNYRAALASSQANDARRRLALNLAMRGDRTAAMALLSPLIANGDPAGLRARAFVLALTGDATNARRAIDAALPGSGAQFEPFFRRLPSLSDAQKAAAVHLGRFPTDAEIAATRITPTPPPTARAVPTPAPAQRVTARPTPTPAPTRSARAEPSAPAQRVPSLETRTRQQYVSTSEMRRSPRPEPRRLASIEQSLTSGAPDETQEALGATAAAAPSAPSAATRETVAAPPPPQPRFEAPPPPRPKVDAPPPPRPKIEAARPAPAPVAAAATTVAAAPDIGVEGTYFVQLAGGGSPGPMAYEYRRLSRQAPKALGGREGLVTQGVEFYRLLVGPFASRSEAQNLVNALRAEGVDSFAWTRNPPLLRIDEL